MSDHIPTTEHVRDAAACAEFDPVGEPEFNRWLAKVKADVLREAADEWSEWETFRAGDGNLSIRMHGKSPNQWLRERAENIEEGKL